MKHAPTIMLVLALLILMSFTGYYTFNLFVKNKTTFIFGAEEELISPPPTNETQPEQTITMPAGYEIWIQKLKIDKEPERSNLEQELHKAEKILATDETNTQALYTIAYCNFVQGYDAKARVYFDRLLQADSANKDAQYGKAYLFYKAKQPTKALEIIEKVEHTDPKDAQPLVIKGIILESLNDISQAKVSYSKALQLDRTNKFAQKSLMKLN